MPSLLLKLMTTNLFPGKQNATSLQYLLFLSTHMFVIKTLNIVPCNHKTANISYFLCRKKIFFLQYIFKLSVLIFYLDYRSSVTFHYNLKCRCTYIQQFIPQRNNRFKCANWFQAFRQSRPIASELTWYI